MSALHVPLRLAPLLRRARAAIAWLGTAARLDNPAMAPEPTPPIIRIRREPSGRWTVVAADDEPCVGFTELDAALAHARQSCAATPATLWLDIDGLLVVVLQDAGWTRPLIGEAT